MLSAACEVALVVRSTRSTALLGRSQYEAGTQGLVFGWDYLDAAADWNVGGLRYTGRVGSST